MAQQTAVEWLAENIDNLIPFMNNDIAKKFSELVQQAKEMEKQQQGYSEEDMIKFAEFVATYLDKNRNVNGEMLHAKSKYDGAERTIDLLKQYKKK